MEYAEHPDPGPLLLLARKHLPSLLEGLDETLRDEMDLDPARSLPADHGEMVRLLQDLMTEAKHGSEQKRRD